MMICLNILLFNRFMLTCGRIGLPLTGMSVSDDFREFEEQLRLQNAECSKERSRVRVDPDGTAMEWDEARRAWFPKIDDDFIARYQMSYGVPSQTTGIVQSGAATNNLPNETSSSLDWSTFNARLAKLREEKGENSEEVQHLTRAAHEALTSYYNSPAYREWYESYCKQLDGSMNEASVASQRTVSLQGPKPTKIRHDVKPSERVRCALADDGGLNAEQALARAEAEQQAGVPIASETHEEDNGPDCLPSNETVIDAGAAKAANKRKVTAPPPAWYEVNDEKNTHIYVTGLPPDITEAAFYQLMSKYGVIMNEPFTDKPRIKLYKDEFGNPKGDGRCCYVKVESVDLALKLLDGMMYTPEHTLHAERAKFQPKGAFDPKKRRRLTLKEKKKLKEQQESLFRWGIDTSKFVRGKKERVIVLKNAFVEADFLHDVTLIPVVRDRLRAQCAKCGTVKKIVVHDANPLGAVTVTFSTPEEADTALGFLNNALFDYPGPGGPRQLAAERWDGKTNYAVKEDKNVQLSRIHKWEEFLGGESSSDEDGAVLKETETEQKQSITSMNSAPDYWETSSQESPVSGADTEDAGGESGDETP
ncbi:unnamed protein product [Dicrocoelium dendriticum]|nr:unnamed protein product [Dicrocoelium dendriticum]